MKEEKGKAISKSWVVAGVAARSRGGWADDDDNEDDDTHHT